MNLGEIIKRYREKHGLSMDAFAEKANLSKGYISMLEKNENPRTKKPIVPTLETYSSVAAAMNISLNQLVGMVDSSSEINISDVFRYDNIFPLPKTKKVPLVGTIACGTPIFADENIEAYIEVPLEYNVDFCLKCKGDSMINARIFDGDIVYIQKQEDVDNGEIAAVLIGEEATLKKVFKSKDKLTLRAENPLWPDMIYQNEELDEIRILGKALLFLSKVR